MSSAITIVSVFNNKEVLDRCLVRSLDRQKKSVDFVAVDNTLGRFSSATQALNWGAAQASGDWIVFLHQDIVLLTDSWTQMLSTHLDELNSEGWCGVCGRDNEGIWHGLLRDRDGVYGEPFDQPLKVQTLDEIVLIHRRMLKGHAYFDEKLAGWHAYGVDACCQAILDGHENYVLPLPVWHDSPSTNRQGLNDSHAFVEKKFKGLLPLIRTTCGDIPFRFRKRGSYRWYVLYHKLLGLKYSLTMGLRGGSLFERRRPWQVVDDWTKDFPVVDCYRDIAWYDQIEAVGFSDSTALKRRVRHWFGNFQNPGDLAPILVVGPEVCRSAEFPRLDAQTLITVEVLPKVPVSPAGYSCMQRELCRDQDDRYWLISKYLPQKAICS